MLRLWKLINDGLQFCYFPWSINMLNTPAPLGHSIIGPRNELSKAPPTAPSCVAVDMGSNVGVDIFGWYTILDLVVPRPVELSCTPFCIVIGLHGISWGICVDIFKAWFNNPVYGRGEWPADGIAVAPLLSSPAAPLSTCGWCLFSGECCCTCCCPSGGAPYPYCGGCVLTGQSISSTLWTLSRTVLGQLDIIWPVWQTFRPMASQTPRHSTIYLQSQSGRPVGLEGSINSCTNVIREFSKEPSRGHLGSNSATWSQKWFCVISWACDIFNKGSGSHLHHFIMCLIHAQRNKCFHAFTHLHTTLSPPISNFQVVSST